ncbi:MAG: NUDIX domain-containing protein [Planctomycetaceae bacterium]|nr:NUDIX domain-containing protein [Planctomycetaceae bacterium]
MSPVKSCGVLVVRGEPIREFLLMRHADRWDLPKGHVDPGETEAQCALREVREETGISASDLELIDGFRFESHYQVRAKKSDRLYDKTLVIFLGRLNRDVPIAITEHIGYEWFAWNPPHQIQAWTIDPLLDELARFLKPK